MKQVYTIVVTNGELKKVVEIREAIQLLIKEFKEFFLEELPTSLPLICDI